MKRFVALLLALALVLSACSQEETAPAPETPSPVETPAAPEEPAPETPAEPVPEEEAEESSDPDALHPYVAELLADIVAEISTPEMSDYEKTKAAFDYMMEHTIFHKPIGLALWRIHGGGEEPIPYIQQRALSPLRYGIGTCEDYASALALLLRALGLEADYVPGLTYSKEGHLVDHAWTVVKIDGSWYHLDSQLEDNISQNGTVRYRYFLKGDATMSASHRWGQNMMDGGFLTPEQEAELRESYLTPACPEDYPATEPQPKVELPDPDPEALEAQAQEEIAAWEAENGPLAPMELNSTPPIFGLEGYGPADEG